MHMLFDCVLNPSITVSYPEALKENLLPSSHTCRLAAQWVVRTPRWPVQQVLVRKWFWRLRYKVSAADTSRLKV